MSNNDLAHRTIQDMLGSVIEIAIRDQKTAENLLIKLAAAIESFHSTSHSLPSVVANKVQQQIEGGTDQAAKTIIKKFEQANISAVKATEAYERVVKKGFIQIALPILGFTFISLIVIVFAVFIYVPSFEEIKDRQRKNAILISEIEFLTQLKKLDYRKCSIAGGEIRICAKLDAQFSKSKSDYRVLAEK